MAEVLPEMYYKEETSHPSTGVVKSKTLQVVGKNLDSVELKFNKKFNKIFR